MIAFKLPLPRRATRLRPHAHPWKIMFKGTMSPIKKVLKKCAFKLPLPCRATRLRPHARPWKVIFKGTMSPCSLKRGKGLN